MPNPIIVVDSSAVRTGKIEELRAVMSELAEFVEANEADPFAYHVYFDEDGGRMTVVQIHPSSASLEQHLNLASPIFSRTAGLLELQRVDVYGRPSETVLEQIRRKAQMLGGAAVVVNARHAGFTRFG